MQYAYLRWRKERQIPRLRMSAEHIPLPCGAPTHKGPVSEGKEPSHRVEWNAVARSFRVMVWRCELRTGGGETTAGDGVDGAGEHLYWLSI